MGYVPEKIAFVYSDNIEAEGKKVIPMYPVDPANAKRMDSAKSWANKGNWANHNKGKKEAKVHEVVNGPFKEVVINKLEFRSQGGRAYKVIVNGDWYCDLREAELMWIIENKGIRKGGTMNGEFIFVVLGAQTKLVPIGSDAHKVAIKEGKERIEKKLSLKDLQVGHVYHKPGGYSGRPSIYLGAAYTSTITSHYHWGGGLRRSRYVYTIDKVSKPARIHVFWEISASDDCSNIDAMAMIQASDGYLEFKKSCTFTRDLGVARNVPTIQQLKDFVIKGAKSGKEIGDSCLSAAYMVAPKDRKSFVWPEELVYGAKREYHPLND